MPAVTVRDHLRLVPPAADPVDSPEWLEAVRAGDRRAIARGLEHVLPRVRRWLFRLLGPRAELEDATQDALTEIAVALPRFEGRSTLATLAHRITVRVAYRYFGSRGDERSRGVAMSLVDARDPERASMERELLGRLYEALEAMPAKRRVAFVLCAVEGLDPKEAAAIEGCSGLAMRSRLLQARRDVDARLALSGGAAPTGAGSVTGAGVPTDEGDAS